MRSGNWKKVIAIIIVAVCITGFGLVENEGDFLSNFGGYYYVSDIQNHPSNSSYSVIFHEVNFTFLYWYWPMCSVENNVTICVGEQPVSVYVEVTFPDNFSELLILVVDSPGSCLIGISSVLHGTLSTHSNPKVGLATAETEELHDSWVYIVSLL
jgi:hypothetical protein